ncbi:MAG: ABC transporter permease [Candidatus Krumholzibacteriota bacterium]|nr:ABC transporter permease [Candidatus Krumholzibacteriota bacterium]
MPLMEGIRLALSAIWAHKLRSFLVMLGNVIAVASIIAVVSIVDGMNTYMHEKVFERGSGVVNLQRLDEMQILTDIDAFMKTIYNPPLTLADREYLLDRLPSASFIGASRRTRDQVRRGDERLQSVPVRGYTSEYPFLEKADLSAGRHFTELEVQRSRPVAVIGHHVAEVLFPGVDPLGRKIKVADRPYQVIGVAAEKGRLLGEDQDTFVTIPISSFQKTYGHHGRGRSLTITIKARSLDAVPELMEEIRTAMRLRHHLRPGEDDDFAITSSETMLGLWDKIKNILLSVLMMVVGISAVVAGIVIMNIMLVSVQERTREIGIRKAIGARYGDVLRQFLTEALTLSMTGGILGILLGYGAAALIAHLSPLPYAAKVWSILLGLALTVAVGGIFGIVPARRAARLDPVEALHYE